MRAEALTQGMEMAIRVAKTGPTTWESLSERLSRFFQHHCESDWERTAGQPWTEWLRLEEKIPMAIRFTRKKWT